MAWWCFCFAYLSTRSSAHITSQNIHWVPSRFTVRRICYKKKIVASSNICRVGGVLELAHVVVFSFVWIFMSNTMRIYMPTTETPQNSYIIHHKQYLNYQQSALYSHIYLGTKHKIHKRAIVLAKKKNKNINKTITYPVNEWGGWWMWMVGTSIKLK